jgi:uncharacterized protein (TIGR03435 family)
MNAALWSQSASSTLAFDVTSARIATAVTDEVPGGWPEHFSHTPTSLTMQNVRLKSALQWAYKLGPFQVTGPDFLDSERYDIIAKTGSPTSEDRLRLMLQKLLGDRFRVGCHRETKERPAFVLTVARGGSRLTESLAEGEGSFQPRRNSAMSARSTTIAEFAELLAKPLGAPVVDKTGLKGRYDFSLDLNRYITGDMLGLEDVPGVFAQALLEQLGLKLDTRKCPIDLLVVDHADRVPTEN